MSTAVKLHSKDARSISFQEASLDIWDKKYRLTAKDGTPLDRTMDATYKRVAHALADVEVPGVREHWYEQFLWALRGGAHAQGRLRLRLRILDAAAARRVRVGGRCVHVGTAVVHGYLRQDVFH